MKYIIASAEVAKNLEIPDNIYAVMIRALEPRKKNDSLLYADRYKDILELHYDDMTDEEYIEYNLQGSNIKIFSNEDAKKLIDFYSKHKQADLFVIHCYAGKSRSSAMAIGLAKYLKDENMENEILTSKNKYIPNPTVISKIKNELESENL